VKKLIRFGFDAQPSEFIQNRLQPQNCLFVNYSVGRQNAVVILHVGDVVMQRKPENVGHSPARFFENNLRRARIPEFSCADLNEHINRRFGQRLNRFSIRPSRAESLVGNQIFNNAVHSRTAVIAARSEINFSEIRFAGNYQPLGFSATPLTRKAPAFFDAKYKMS
jgi:hypothetical protein